MSGAIEIITQVTKDQQEIARLRAERDELKGELDQWLERGPIKASEVEALATQRDELLRACKVALEQMRLDGHSSAFDGLGTHQYATVRDAITRAEAKSSQDGAA